MAAPRAPGSRSARESRGGRCFPSEVRDGALVRHYHDTDRWSAPFAPAVDAQGCARCSGNRRVDLLVERERTYAGGEARASAVAPAHLHNALRVLCRHQHRRRGDITEFARALGVRAATAWSYAYRVVDTWPRAHDEVARLVHPEILQAVCACPHRRSGTLRELLQCIHSDLVEAREVADLFAHLRLARICAEAREKHPPAVQT